MENPDEQNSQDFNLYLTSKRAIKRFSQPPASQLRYILLRKPAKTVRTTLGEKLWENRMRCKMSQEFVAEAVDVSRRAVSKWENGISDPSTSNLIAQAKLCGLSAEELLEGL